VVEGHPEPHIWNQRPQNAYSLYSLHGLRWRLRGVYMDHPLLKSSFRPKNFQVPSKPVPIMAVFRECYFVLSPKKAHASGLKSAGPSFFVKIGSDARAVGCWKNPEIKKQNKQFWREISRIRGNRNPLRDRDKTLRIGRYPGPNHVCYFWWRSVKGFGRGKGSNFPFSHWLVSSPLQQSRTTVWACDKLSTQQFWLSSLRDACLSTVSLRPRY